MCKAISTNKIADERGYTAVPAYYYNSELSVLMDREYWNILHKNIKIVSQ